MTRSISSQLLRTIVLSSSAVTLAALLVGIVVGAGVVIREEDATSMAMVRVFQSEIADHTADAVLLDAEIREEVSEQRSFARQIEVWRGAQRVGAGPRATLLATTPVAANGCDTERVAGRYWRLCVASGLMDTRIVVATPLEPLVRGIGRFALAILVAAVAGMLAFASVSRRLVRETLRPLEELQRAVADIEGARSEARIGTQWGVLEIDALSSTFDALLARIEAATIRERQFLFDASHELRTPLTRLRAQLETVADDASLTPELAARISAARASCAALILITESVLALARDELPQGETVNVSDVVRALTTQRFQDASGRIALDVDDEALLRADDGLVSMALGNLIENALKFSTGMVSVSVHSDSSTVRVAVEDEGPGIPASERALVLEPFYRGAAARGQTHGTGLGLALARHVATAYGGQLVLEARTPHGLRAVVTLPPWRSAAATG